MKIYLLPVNSSFQPELKNPYPIYNKKFSLEKEFLNFLMSSKSLLTNDKKLADYFYLPIFWTNWLVQHDYGKNNIEKLKDYVKKMDLDPRKTFTICQYGDGTIVNLGKTKVFLGSRKTKNGYDFPIVSLPHKEPFIKPRKKYLASFVGRLNTHPIREKMHEVLVNTKSVYIYSGSKSEKFFVRKILNSYLSLCPRGFGGTSFRFFESMQLGVVPILIGDIDTRPFKRQINWDEISFYVKKVEEIDKILNFPKKKLIKMGTNAKKIWYEKFYNNRAWCKMVLKELTYEK